MSTTILFNSICIVHLLVWFFVLIAFVNKKTAYFNLFYLVPLIYILHILPFHVLIQMKENLEPITWEDKDNELKSILIIPKLFDKSQKYLEKNCFMSPLSAQGMLIFGAISSAWALKARFGIKETF